MLDIDITLSITEQTPTPENEIKWKAYTRSCAAKVEIRPPRSGRMSTPEMLEIFSCSVSPQDDANTVKEVGRLANGKELNNVGLVESRQTGDGGRGRETSGVMWTSFLIRSVRAWWAAWIDVCTVSCGQGS